MNSGLAMFGPYLALVLIGFLPNEFWRMLGIIASRSLDEGSELLMWVRAVATAVLAGVISQLILTPPGPLATLPLAARLGAVAVGFAGCGRRGLGEPQRAHVRSHHRHFQPGQEHALQRAPPHTRNPSQRPPGISDVVHPVRLGNQ